MNISYWEYKSYFSNIDVAIIGSGIVGLHAALNLKLKRPHLNIVVLERGVLPQGASTKNAGFACIGSPSELLDDLKNNSEESVFQLVEKRYKGLKKLRKNLGDKNIDFKQWGGYEIFDDHNSFQNCADELSYLNRQLMFITKKKKTYSIEDKKIKKFQLSNIKHIIHNSVEGQIDTGKMMTSLISKVRKMGVVILNGIEVNHFLDIGNAVSIRINNAYEFATKKIIVCTNGFARQLLPDSPINPARGQVLVTNEIKGLKIKGSFHYDKGYYYFRNIGNRILLGGGRNLDFKGEQTYDMKVSNLIQNKLEELLKNVILKDTPFKIEHRWSGIMGIGENKKYILKHISENSFCAVGMGGMGVAIGSLVGEEVALLVLDSFFG